MRKIQILVLIFFLSSCASLQSEKPKTLEDYQMLTDEPDPSAMTLTAQAEINGRIPPENCPVTLPEKATFEAPEPYSTNVPWDGFFWYGSDELWTVLRTDGVWAGLPLNPEGYTQKIMWWSDQYVLQDELQPALVVTGKRLDVEAPPLKFHGATNAFADDIGDAMLIGVDFPMLGCWEITGQYKETELSFVVWIAP